jgi:hypothetical protein
MSATLCTNCGAATVDVYCAQCGEKQPHHHDLKVSHFTHDVFHELVHLDSKLFTTLRDLIVRPGQLTVEYFAGRKKRAIAPLRLYLTLFALQFIAFTVYKPAAIYSIEAFTNFDKAGALQQMVQRKAAKHHMTAEQYTEKVDARWHKNLSLLQLAHVIGMAVVLKLIYLRRRRYLVEHLVFSAHYLAFAYIVSLAFWPIYAVYGFHPGTLQKVLSTVAISISLVYLYFAQRRFYGQSKGKTVLKTALLFGGIYVVSVVVLAGSLIAALVAYR